MFEFYGWIAIIGSDTDDDASWGNALREIHDFVEPIRTHNRSFHVHTFNGLCHLIFSGCHNHRDPRIVEFFKTVAEVLPLSYGKLFIRDQEDSRGYGNSMQEWTMARSRIVETTDELMSPCIPTI